MSLRVEYHELVDLDLSNAWNWYEDQEEGLGDRLLSAIHATVVRASRWPNAGRPVLRDDDRLLVMAVLHQSRHPNFGDDRQA